MLLRKMGTTAETVGAGLELRAIVTFLEKFAPRETAESWDNVGLLVEPQKPTPVHSALLTNDLTEDVVQEAVKIPVQLIVSYHPPIFQPKLTAITTATWKERIIGTCIEDRIAIYSPHTSWDATIGGVSDWLLSPFEKEEVEVVKGAGRVCDLKQSSPLQEIVNRYKQLAKLQHVRLALARKATLDTPVKRIAVCAGSGSSVLAGTSADLWVTGEMSHHALLDATHSGTSVLLLEHSNSERGFLTHFAESLRQQFSNLAVHISKSDKDPVLIL